MLTRPFFKIEKTEREEAGAFGPDKIAVMTAALEYVLRDLKLSDRDDPIVIMIAKLIIELVRNGERDPEQLRMQVLSRYRVAFTKSLSALPGVTP